MSNDLEQGSVRVQLGNAPRHNATGLALRIGQVGIVDAGAAAALEFAANRAG